MGISLLRHLARYALLNNGGIMAGKKNPNYKGPLKICTNCLMNDRISKHHNCLYCAECKARINKEIFKKSILQWKRNNRDHLAKYRAKNYHKWKDNINAYQREENKNLTDTYLRGTIARGEKFSSKDVTQEMIEIKRLLIKLQRAKGDKRCENKNTNKEKQ